MALFPNLLGRLRDSLRTPPPVNAAPPINFDTTTGWSFDSAAAPTFDRTA